MMSAATRPQQQAAAGVDFNNTAIAFAHKSDSELKQTARLFAMMNKHWLVKLGSPIALKAVQWRLPFAQTIIKHTIFEQFCGGTSLEESKTVIERLRQHNVLTVLDYGAEAKETEPDFEKTMRENIAAVQFAATQKSVPLVSTKVTGMLRFALLEKVDAKEPLTDAEKAEWARGVHRLEQICEAAHHHKIGIFIDAEESWIQDAIDEIAIRMMQRFNKEQAIVFNTFQCYRHDRFAYLTALYERARVDGYILGAKLVRGAYMEKERARAAEKGYPSPINADKAATDSLYNNALRFCVNNYEHISLWNATHNQESTALLTHLMEEKNIAKSHPHLNFCQLYGMSDNLTFNLAAAGYNVGKYLPYGTVQEVIPYLIRRAQENSTVTGDMSREYQFIQKELQRRKR